MKPAFIPALIACLHPSTGPALAQTSASPYVGQETGDIKALSSEDVDAYLSGKGMGLAKAAELNGYAGPSHVLEIASQLDLTREALSSALAEIGALQAKVRGAHLEAHLAQVEILTPEQNARYAQLRGYGESAAHPGNHSHHGH